MRSVRDRSLLKETPSSQIYIPNLIASVNYTIYLSYEAIQVFLTKVNQIPTELNFFKCKDTVQWPEQRSSALGQNEDC